VSTRSCERTVEHIRSNGYQGRFYRRTITYYEEEGLVHWTMGAPIHETTIINICRKGNTFEYRRNTGPCADVACKTRECSVNLNPRERQEITARALVEYHIAMSPSWAGSARADSALPSTIVTRLS
jgi:hypothetical protein